MKSRNNIKKLILQFPNGKCYRIIKGIFGKVWVCRVFSDNSRTGDVTTDDVIGILKAEKWDSRP